MEDESYHRLLNFKRKVILVLYCTGCIERNALKKIKNKQD